MVQEENKEVEFSIVVSCYFEEKSIDEFHSRLISAMRDTERSFEIIYINDGSSDGTLEKLHEIFERDQELSVVCDLFKNVGQANAKTPGILHARGKALVLIDSDLQLDPEDVSLLIQKYDEGYDIVSGYRKTRKDSFIRVVPSKIANWLMRKASKSNIRDFGCTFKIYDMRLVKAFKFDVFKPWRMLPVLAQARKIAEVPVAHHPRRYGKSGWTFSKLFAYNMETIVALSERPFQYVALFCAIGALTLFLRVLLGVFFPGSVMEEVSNGLLLNALVIGILLILSVLSMVGEFVIRQFVALQSKPSFITRGFLQRDTKVDIK